jgi:N-acetylmuramic acid 6-phosphate etherase
VLLTCAEREGLDGVADTILALATGAEILSGSTRLKAGSATKAALNALTTTAMVRSGKVYGSLMVDLRPGSRKLVDRALRIVSAATGLGRSEAADLLEGASGEVKTAIVMALARLDPKAARERLALVRGDVRKAIAGAESPC